MISGLITITLELNFFSINSIEYSTYNCIFYNLVFYSYLSVL